MNDIAPPILRNRFCLNDDVSLRCTRNTNRNLLRPPLCRTQFYQNSFQYIGAVTWNSLSDECRNSNSLSIFKKAVMQEINSIWRNIFLSHEPVKCSHFNHLFFSVHNICFFNRGFGLGVHTSRRDNVLILVYDFYNGFSLGFVLSRQPLCAAFCSLFAFLLCSPYCDAKQVLSIFIEMYFCLFVCLPVLNIDVLNAPFMLIEPFNVD